MARDLRTVNLTVISASDLKKVAHFGKQSSYVVAYIYSSSKQETDTDEDGGVNPTWNSRLVLEVDDQQIMQGRTYITLEIHSSGTFGGKLIGTARVPLSDIARQSGPQFMALEVKRDTGETHGVINVSVAVGEKRGGPAYRPQGYASQGSPQQPYPPQGYSSQGPPQQAYPPQAYPPQRPPQQAYAPQGYAPQQGYPPQYAPQQAYYQQPPPQGYYPQPGYSQQGYPQQGYQQPPPQVVYVEQQQPARRQGGGLGGAALGAGAGLLGGLVIGDVIGNMDNDNDNNDNGGDDNGGYDNGGYDDGGYDDGGGGFDGGDFGDGNF